MKQLEKNLNKVQNSTKMYGPSKRHVGKLDKGETVFAEVLSESFMEKMGLQTTQEVSNH